MFCLGDRACATAPMHDSYLIVDAATGQQPHSHYTVYEDVVVDTSGALAWRDPTNALMTSGSFANEGHALRREDVMDNFCGFQWGICVARVGKAYHVLRFDGDLTPAVKLKPVARFVQWFKHVLHKVT